MGAISGAASGLSERETATGGDLKRKIVGFHQDEQLHWVADLECGHTQHVRHDPPWMVRPWVVTPEGRESFLGFELDCKKCEE
ncbi:MAG TPA: DUF3565 domain-containing protein [Thermoanaerobaculia bacterium]